MEIDTIGFLSKSRNAICDGTAVQVEASQLGYCRFYYAENSFMYTNTYMGKSKFAGQETIYKNGFPVWIMNYIGRLIDRENFARDFLEEALLCERKDFPFRGPSRYIIGDHSYRCNINGGFKWFCGYEEQYLKRHKVFECAFHGGDIDRKKLLKEWKMSAGSWDRDSE